MSIQWTADIPLEVREMFYLEFFEDLRVRPVRVLSNMSEKDQHHAGFPLFLVNKQVHDECKVLFYKHAIFDLRQPQDRAPCSDSSESIRHLIQSKSLDLSELEKVVCSDPFTAKAILRIREGTNSGNKACVIHPLRELIIDYQWKVALVRESYLDTRLQHDHTSWQKLILQETFPSVMESRESTEIRYKLQSVPLQYDLLFDEIMLGANRDSVTLRGPCWEHKFWTRARAVVIATVKLARSAEFMWEVC